MHLQNWIMCRYTVSVLATVYPSSTGVVWFIVSQLIRFTPPCACRHRYCSEFPWTHAQGGQSYDHTWMSKTQENIKEKMQYSLQDSQLCAYVVILITQVHKCDPCSSVQFKLDSQNNKYIRQSILVRD